MFAQLSTTLIGWRLIAAAAGRHRDASRGYLTLFDLEMDPIKKRCVDKIK